MPKMITAQKDKNLKALIKKRTSLAYHDQAEHSDRPPHVRAASSLAPMREELAIIQDDAQFLALVKPDDPKAVSIPLPASASGYRVFDDKKSKKEKIDLEACVAVPGTNNRLLVAFGSGSKESREWIMTVDWREEGDRPNIELHHADSLFNYMREQKEFCGAGLNIEGAIFPDNDTLRLYQRGNKSKKKLPSIDATADLDWSDVLAYLDHEETEPPKLHHIVQYDLGEANGAPLNFSDAEKVDEFVLYSASAESGTSGENKGSALGIIDGEQVRWCELEDENGEVFTGKIEGLSVDPKNPKRIWFVIDDDDAEKPSDMFEAELQGNWYDHDPKNP